MPRTERDRELAKRRQRKAKIKKLEKKYAAATSAADKELIVAKVRRMSPMLNFVARVEGTEAK
ncbi:hypothetical protein Plim_2021 [Planctopirus limnophila DSM 3776]|jgi:hypothetical protein|uniref:Uncharacterized protein n=3 Tax=Planctopirus TaxID=1649480 RepID=D5SYR7_PLAL2|nr:MULTISPECIES: DUF6800 family protein [Planctopirus]ADG67849.1 hypothetical protein Plim_2021 [Planctopirus limnophila DSM 3776]ODA32816.1 hypothetical protein A6X21_21090 [Planctopirus hydrillae]QDV30904.1 hypothetical protein Spb1_28400 [Planctopirus ephydatiae]